MNNKASCHDLLTLVILGILLVSSVSSQVSAQPGGPFDQQMAGSSVSEVVPGGPGFVMVSGFNFHPYDPDYSWGYNGAAIYNPSTTDTANYVTGITLPHGATITKMTLYFKDESDSNITCNLIINDGTWSFGSISEIVTSGNSPIARNASTTVIYTPVVDNQVYAYSLALSMPPESLYKLMVGSVRIDYAYEVEVPLVMR